MARRSPLPLLFAAVLAAGCGGDPANFRPAKGAAEQPAVKESFRVKAVAPECVSLGYINADGPRALDEIAETAARHGANNYMIVNDNGDERVTTRGNDELVTRTNHKLLAEAYRCPMSGDLPH
ncbi:MAG: hypothetical protein JWP87_2169 [Labilithrix sp.]|nr:hypothetical protein [Labilithrix sp.]